MLFYISTTQQITTEYIDQSHGRKPVITFRIVPGGGAPIGRDTANTVDEPLRFGGGGVLSSHIFLYIFYITHLSSTNPYFSP